MNFQIKLAKPYFKRIRHALAIIAKTSIRHSLSIKDYNKEIWLSFLGKLNPCNVANAIKQTQFRNIGSGTPKIIGYLPKDAGGWILELLFKDLSSFAPEGTFIFTNCVAAIKLECIHSEKSIILCLHQGFLELLIKSGVPPAKIVCLYTHSRLGMLLPDYSDKIRAYLPMSTHEASQLLLGGIDKSKIHLFPIGYDHTLFHCDSDPQELDPIFDCVFSVAYFIDRGQHYELRKNYPLLINIAEILANKGKNVAIIGRNWSEAPICSSPYIKLFDIDHVHTADIYRKSKVFVNVSRQEGGLTAWLEAFASGCLMLCTPTGFAIEYKTGEDGSYIFPQSATALEWGERIIQLIDSYSILTKKSIQNRKHFLYASRFKTLSQYLLDLANSPSTQLANLRWPSWQGDF